MEFLLIHQAPITLYLLLEWLGAKYVQSKTSFKKHWEIVKDFILESGPFSCSVFQNNKTFLQAFGPSILRAFIFNIQLGMPASR